jgi:ribose-phosphate pyrophosphokinase
MTATLHSFASNEPEARRLAGLLGCDFGLVELRQFPDGESLVRVGKTEAKALLYCSLNDPDAKIVQLLLAVSALRDRGARQVVLVAPYLGYMRQDRAFAPGEAVSQRVIGNLISSAFNGLVTVDPHLHRTPRLEDAFPGVVSVNVSAAATIAEALASRIKPGCVLVGPDEESLPWVKAVAAPLGLEAIVARKVRRGDREVEIELPDATNIAGKPVILIDDLVSSGTTLMACAGQLRAAGASSIGAAVTHCLANSADLDALAASGIAPVLATDTVPGRAACIPMAAALADAILHHGLA